jgi:hypothetical protein
MSFKLIAIILSYSLRFIALFLVGINLSLPHGDKRSYFK